MFKIVETYLQRLFKKYGMVRDDMKKYLTLSIEDHHQKGDQFDYFINNCSNLSC